MMNIDDFRHYEETVSSAEMVSIPQQDKIFFESLPQVFIIRKPRLAIIN